MKIFELFEKMYLLANFMLVKHPEIQDDLKTLLLMVVAHSDDWNKIIQYFLGNTKPKFRGIQTFFDNFLVKFIEKIQMENISKPAPDSNILRAYKFKGFKEDYTEALNLFKKDPFRFLTSKKLVKYFGIKETKSLMGSLFLEKKGGNLEPSNMPSIMTLRCIFLDLESKVSEWQMKEFNDEDNHVFLDFTPHKKRVLKAFKLAQFLPDTETYMIYQSEAYDLGYRLCLKIQFFLERKGADKDHAFLSLIKKSFDPSTLLNNLEFLL